MGPWPAGVGEGLPGASFWQGWPRRCMGDAILLSPTAPAHPYKRRYRRESSFLLGPHFEIFRLYHSASSFTQDVAS